MYYDFPNGVNLVLLGSGFNQQGSVDSMTSGKHAAHQVERMHVNRNHSHSVAKCHTSHGTPLYEQHGKREIVLLQGKRQEWDGLVDQHMHIGTMQHEYLKHVIVTHHHQAIQGATL